MSILRYYLVFCSFMDFWSYVTIGAISLLAGFLNVIVWSGSAITIPFLIFFGLPPQTAIATNRFAMIFNNSTWALSYHIRKRLPLRMALIFSLFAAAGAIIWAYALTWTKPEIVNTILWIILLIEVIVVLFNTRRLWLEPRNIALTTKNYIIWCSFMFFIGLYWGFVWMATSLIIFFSVIFYHFRFIESAAIAKLVTFVISIFASLIFIMNWLIDFSVWAILVFSYVIWAILGVNSAIKMWDERVKWLFVVIMIISAVKLLVF